jgi:hypothetical protein
MLRDDKRKKINENKPMKGGNKKKQMIARKRSYFSSLTSKQMETTDDCT